MKTFKKIFLFLIFFFLVIQKNFAEKFKINVIFQTNVFPLNKNIFVRLDIEYEGVVGKYIISEPYIEKLDNLEIVGSSVENVIEPVMDNTNYKIIKKSYIYNLKGISPGKAYFPAAKVAIVDKKGDVIEQLETSPITLKVTEPEKKINYFKFLYIILGLMLLAGLGTGFLYFLKIYKLKKEEKKRIQEELEKSKITIEQKYLNEISEKEANIKSLNETYSFFDRIIKNYLEEKYNLKLKDKSTAEILNLLNSSELLSKEKFLLVKSILEEIDIVKFARSKVTDSQKEELKNKIISFLS